TGPLKDIHRIRLVETIAEGIKPGALAQRMTTVMGQARAAMNVNFSGGGRAASPAFAPIGGGSVGGGVTVNFSPVVTVNGGGPDAEMNFRRILDQYRTELVRVIREETDLQRRRSFR